MWFSLRFVLVLEWNSGCQACVQILHLQSYLAHPDALYTAPHWASFKKKSTERTVALLVMPIVHSVHVCVRMYVRNRFIFSEVKSTPVPIVSERLLQAQLLQCANLPGSAQCRVTQDRGTWNEGSPSYKGDSVLTIKSYFSQGKK